MSYMVICPSCGHAYQTEGKALGKKGWCSACQETFVLEPASTVEALEQLAKAHGPKKKDRTASPRPRREGRLRKPWRTRSPARKNTAERTANASES